MRETEVEIFLQPEENHLDEVVLKAKGLKEKRLGRTNRGLGLMHYNYYTVHEEEVDDRLGKELGMNLKLRKSCRLDKFNFAISTNEFKKLKLRLNIYDLQNDQPDSLLISDNILIELEERETGWQSIDLDSYNIFLQEELGEILVTLQWLESEKTAEESKYFAIPASKSPFHKVYFRDKAMDTWTVQTGSLSMYVDARCR